MNSDALITNDHDDVAKDALVAVRSATARLASAYPFHAGLLSRWFVVTNRVVPTAGVTARVEGVYLVVCPEFVLGITADELVGVLHHEVNHVLFGHVFEDRSKYPDERARIIAEEVTVNEWVPEALPGEPIVLAQFPKLPEGEDTETRYKRLARKTKKKDEKVPETLDDHGTWGDAQAAGEAGRLAVRAVVRAAAETAGAAAWANLPEPMREAIAGAHGDGTGDMLEALLGKGESTIDWRGALRRLVTAEMKVEPRYGRPPRRFPHLAGVVPGTARKPGRPRILAVIDTSGSIDTAALQAMSAELSAMSVAADITVAECDAVIHRVYGFETSLGSVQGRGGTDLRPPFEAGFLREHNPDGIVYLTDGYGPAPANPPRQPVWWCLTPGGTRPAKWGRLLQMRA